MGNSSSVTHPRLSLAARQSFDSYTMRSTVFGIDETEGQRIPAELNKSANSFLLLVKCRRNITAGRRMVGPLKVDAVF